MQADPHERPSIGPDHQLPAPAGKPQHKGIRWAVWIVLLVVFAAAFLLVLRHHDDTKKAGAAAGGRRGGPGAGPTTITTVTAQRGDIGVYIDAIGTVTPVYTASITAQVNGVVTAVHYHEGQLVHKGDPLIDLDDRQYRANLLQAQGALQRDEGLLAEVKMDADRYQAAWDRNAIPKQQLDDQLKLVQQDEGTVKNDQGVVQYDQIQVDFCHITAPITGRVGLRLVDPGNLVQANGTTPLVVITQMQPITVIFTVPEDSLSQILPAMRKKAKLEVDAFDRTDMHKIAAGTLLSLDNQIDTTTGTVKARAQYDNKSGELYPNGFVNARLLVNTLRDAVLIPTSSIQHNGQASFVYVIQSDTAHQVAVTPGVTEGTTTEVQGVNPGDVLANSSFDKLQDKQKVVVAKGNGAGSKPNPNGPGANSPVPAGSGTSSPSGSTAP